MTTGLVAVVGSETLLGREVVELLKESTPAPRVELISASLEGSVAVAADEDAEDAEDVVVMTPLSAASLEGSSAAFLAGSPAASRRALKVNPQGGPVLIDLTGALEEQAQARLRAPLAEPGGGARASSGASGEIQVIAHPAAIAVAMLLTSISKAGAVRRAVVHVFEPASEQGQKGLDELRQQTVGVLSFQKLKQDVYDAQVGFNLLARYGEEALEPLELIEQRVERHLASLLAAWPGVPMPSVRLIQAPVFHGHSMSVWAEFGENPGLEEIARTLEENGVDVRAEEPPSNVGIAGQGGITVGAIAVDANNPRACWFWVVSDNLRLAAENAVAVGRELL